MASVVCTVLALVIFSSITSAATNCIEKLIVTTLTSRQNYAGSDADFNIDVTYKTGLLGLKNETVRYYLYDRPGDDMEQGNGDTWVLDRSGACSSRQKVISLEIKPLTTSPIDILFDGWNIETAQVFGKMTDGEIVLLSVADRVYKTVDHTVVIPHTLKMEASDVVGCYVAKSACIQRILIYTTTSGLPLAGTDGDIALTLGYYNRNNTITLYDRPGNDFERNEGDLFYYDIDKFFPDPCVTYEGINLVRLSAKSNDGLILSNAFITANLKSILPIISDKYALLAAGHPMSTLIDGNLGQGYVDLPLRNNCGE